MVDNVFDNSTVLNPEHPSNACEPILMTEFGIIIDLMNLHLANALSPIDLIVWGSSNDSKLLDCADLKASLSIEVT